MATLMGSPYERGKSDVIVSRLPSGGNKIAEGLFVADAGDGKFEAMGAGKTPFGIMGQQEQVGGSIVVAGLKVYCQTDDATAPAVGAPVYVIPASGKVTATATGNTAINATFCENALKDNGRVNNVGAGVANVKCVAINMLGGA